MIAFNQKIGSRDVAIRAYQRGEALPPELAEIPNKMPKYTWVAMLALLDQTPEDAEFIWVGAIASTDLLKVLGDLREMAEGYILPRNATEEQRNRAEKVADLVFGVDENRVKLVDWKKD